MPYKFDAGKVAKDHKIAAVATIVLFISLFLPWFGVTYLTYSGSVDGLWHGYMYLTLIISIVVVGLIALAAGSETMPFKLPISLEQTIFIGTGISFVLTLISFLAKPSGTSWKFGSYVGLIAAIVAVAPMAIPAIQARRAGRATTTS
jgi:hypothetical protein